MSELVKPAPLHARCLASVYAGSGIVMACDHCWNAVFAGLSAAKQEISHRAPRKKRKRKR